MREPVVKAPFVVIGADGKEYAVADRGTLGQWLGSGNVHRSTQVWVQETRQWTTVGALGVAKQRPIVVTTGDLAQQRYRTLDVLFTFVGKDAAAFGNATALFGPSFEEALDQLVREAHAMGADALIWIRHQHEWAGQLGGAGVSVTGTAVKFVET